MKASSPNRMTFITAHFKKLFLFECACTWIIVYMRTRNSMEKIEKTTRFDHLTPKAWTEPALSSRLERSDFEIFRGYRLHARQSRQVYRVDIIMNEEPQAQESRYLSVEWGIPCEIDRCQRCTSCWTLYPRPPVFSASRKLRLYDEDFSGTKAKLSRNYEIFIN